MTYIVSFRTSRIQKWLLFTRADTLDEAIDIARQMWTSSIDISAYVDVRIQQEKK